jgi:hypothetical protein
VVNREALPRPPSPARTNNRFIRGELVIKPKLQT